MKIEYSQDNDHFNPSWEQKNALANKGVENGFAGSSLTAKFAALNIFQQLVDHQEGPQQGQ